MSLEREGGLSLEALDFHSVKEPLLTPNSKEALKRNGIEYKDLVHVSFKDYVANHHDVKLLERDLQKARYEHYVCKQREKIILVKEERVNLLANPGLISTKGLMSKIYSSQSMHDSPHHNQSRVSYSNEKEKSQINNESTAIRSEKIKLEKLKKKQIHDLQNIIDYEFMLEEVREKNEKKITQQRQKEEKIKEEKRKYSLAMEILKKRKEEEHEKKLKEEQLEQEAKIKQREEHEAKIKLVEEQKKKVEEAELKLRQINQQKVELKRKKQIQEAEIAERQKKLEKMEEIKKKEVMIKLNLNEMRKERLVKSKSKSMQVAERLKQTIEFNENQIVNLRRNFESKQKLAEELKIRFEDKKKKKVEVLKQKAKEKDKEIADILKKQEINELMKYHNYIKKQDEITRRNQLNHEESIRRLSSEGTRAKLKERLIQENKIRFEKKNSEHLLVLKKKLDNIETRTRLKKHSNELQMKRKFNDLTMRFEDSQDKVIRIDKIHEYIREKKLEEYNERSRRVEVMKINQQKLSEQKQQINREALKKKEEMLDAFQKLMKKRGKVNKEDIYMRLRNLTGGAIRLKDSTLNSGNRGASNDSHKENENEEETYSNAEFYRTKFGNKFAGAGNLSNLDKSTSRTLDRSKFQENSNRGDSKVLVSKTEVDEKVEAYKKELKQGLIDKKTKYDKEEKNLENLIKEQEDETKKADLVEELESVRESNRKSLKKLENDIETKVDKYRESLL